MLTTNTPRHWVVIPAAGVGSRMQSSLPKQYLSLHGAPILQITLDAFLHHSAFAGVMLALAPNDPYWEKLGITGERLHCCEGGRERVDTVFSGLQALRELGAAEDDWVWVHDAARPLLQGREIERMFEVLRNDAPDGALLALPVVDTLKRADQNACSVATVDRNELWRAQTPQVFRLDALANALKQALRDGIAVTDEASAMEYAGFHPRLVEGSERNIKITRPQDLSAAEAFLRDNENS